MSDICAQNIDAPHRVGVLATVPALLAEFDCRIENAIDGLGIDASVFDAPENLIAYPTASAVLERCAEITACPNFGLILGSRHDHALLGPLGSLMQNAPDLGAAISEFCAYQISNSRGAVVYLHRSGNQAVFGYGIYEPKTVAHTQIYSLCLAQGVNIIRALTGGAVEPVEAIFSIREPADTEPYRATLKIPFRFNQPETGLVLHASTLSTPIPGASPREFARLQESFAAMSADGGHVWTGRARHAIRPMLLEGKATTSSMAERLGINLRTLSRRLEAEGTTFQQVLEEVRYAMARELLDITELPVGDIAAALAYADHSNFSEAFRKWSGMAPSEWRKAQSLGRPTSASPSSVPRPES
jgi:AraC-like DNA-binding protein